ncbi:N-acylneuraminate cytidylyltransferase [Sphingobacterium spiritivorum]|uniref:N-acylneuraminate cytidylyltransferase n=1 Tax=Sphingobacterium spiritivorum TaxID=258 RepID=A0A380C5G2_SPHSI|nr:acylneuraminate cytidylyltransferase family protein [Sphingobacterium spiritivorum]SUJ13145.1 N-acylneuraminate cytidylyltransferase [Sphingobacterium spiritivorum]
MPEVGQKVSPAKNIRPINERPLIDYTIEIAEQLSDKYDVDIYLSTDDTEIKEVVYKLGRSKIKLDYQRPEQLASDTAGKLDAIVDVKNFAEQKNNIRYDFVIDLDITSPLRTIVDLDEAIKLLFQNKDALNLFSVSPANRNPYFNMVEETDEGFYTLCKKGQFMTRQSAPRVFDLNASFYIFKSSFFEKEYRTVITEQSLVYEVPHLCFDLDHLIDFEIMSYLITNKRLDFNFNY